MVVQDADSCHLALGVRKTVTITRNGSSETYPVVPRQAHGESSNFMSSYHRLIFGTRNFIWDLALTKIYANCLMSTLNARAALKEASGDYVKPSHFSTMFRSNKRLVS
jgi:hypothetical protein